MLSQVIFRFKCFWFLIFSFLGLSTNIKTSEFQKSISCICYPTHLQRMKAHHQRKHFWKQHITMNTICFVIPSKIFLYVKFKNVFFFTNLWNIFIFYQKKKCVRCEHIMSWSEVQNRKLNMLSFMPLRKVGNGVDNKKDSNFLHYSSNMISNFDGVIKMKLREQNGKRFSFVLISPY